MVDETIQQAASVKPIAPKPATPTAAVPAATTGSVLDMARSRLADLELALASMQSMQDEAAMLRRMIAAAESTSTTVQTKSNGIRLHS